MPQTRTKSGIFGVRVEDIFTISNTTDALDLTWLPIAQTVNVWRSNTLIQSGFSLVGRSVIIPNLVIGEGVRVNYISATSIEPEDANDFDMVGLFEEKLL